MGLAPLGYVLYSQVMHHNPANPHWENRDRFVLSAGHACMLQYACLHLSGYDLSLDDIKQFRQWQSRTPGHPEFHHTVGVEVSTGPLGQGVANAVGFALAEAHLAAQFNRPSQEIVDHHTYFIAGDGDMEEGISSEAASLAGYLGLGKLIGVLRRQRDHDRGSDRPRLPRRRRQAVRVLRLVRAPARDRLLAGADRGGASRRRSRSPTGPRW